SLALHALRHHLLYARALDRIRNLRGATGGPVSFGELQTGADELGRDQGTRAVVNRDEFAVLAIHGLQAIPHGDVPFRAAADDLADLLELLGADQFLDFIHALLAGHDQDFIDLLRIAERLQGIPQDRLAGEGREELVEAHATAAASGDDDSADHDLLRKVGR